MGRRSLISCAGQGSRSATVPALLTASSSATLPNPRSLAWGQNGHGDSVTTRYQLFVEVGGEPEAVHVRRDRAGEPKSVWWERPDGSHGLGGVKAADLLLYRTEHVKMSTGPVVILEGERKVDVLREAIERDLLVVGTSGSDTKPTTEVLQPIVQHAREHGVPIYVWADNDAPGRKHMQRVAETLIEAGGPTPRLITWEDAPRDGGDAADWVEAGCSPALVDLLHNAVAVEPKARADVVRADDARPGGAFNVSAAALARLVIERHGADLLVVDDGDFGTGYALDPTTGIWRPGGATWVQWLVGIAEDLVGEVIRSGLTGRALTAAIAQIQRVERPGMVEQIRRGLVGVLAHLRAGGTPCADVTECRAEAIDSNMRYLGTPAGVVDLHAGELLAPDQGRQALVTWQTPVAFDPAAHHDAVDRLFAHLDPAAVGWWWRVLGFHLLGAPSRRFYVAVGPHSGGKTTLANAIAGTLGPYASRPADDALEARGGSAAGLSPELEAFTAPRRWAIIDEAPRMRIAAPLLKRLSGDASQTFRRLHEQLRTVPATATVLVICNPGSVPKLRLQDEAMADRLRELPYPAVTAPDPTMKETIETDSFRRAFLARLVAAAAAETPRVPPDDVPVVRAATAERVREDVGDVGEFARRIVRGPDRLAFSHVWAAWTLSQDEVPQASEAGGIHKKGLTVAMRAHVPELPAPKQIRIAGKPNPVKGWKGWQLLDEAPAVVAPAKTKTSDAPAEPDPADVDLSEYSRLMLRWEAAVERTPQFEAAAAAVERKLAGAPADAPCNLVPPEDRAAVVRRLAFGRLLAKVRTEGRPQDEALSLWLDAGRPADVPQPAPGAYGSGTTIGDSSPI